MTAKLIETKEDLALVVDALQRSGQIALDTEFESNRSGTTLSLVQLSDGERSFVLDALKLGSLESLRPLLRDEDIVWLVHAGKQDIELLKRATGGHVPIRLFDTQVGWALCGPEYQVSLAYLVARLCNTRLAKGHQNDHWLQRPLTEEQVQYAADDVKYLHEIYRSIWERLEPLGKGELAFQVTLESLQPSASKRKAITLGSYRNLWQLDHQQKGALVYLINWYQQQLETSGKKPLHHKVLFDIAAALPSSVDEMASIKSVPARFAHSLGRQLITPMHKAANAAAPLAASAPPSPYASYDALFNDAWLHCARVEVCHAAQISIELGFPQWVQQEIEAVIEAGQDPRSAEAALVGWRSFLRPYWQSFCEATLET